MMSRLTLTDMFKALKVELHRDKLFELMNKFEPTVKDELIKYLGGLSNE